jgi:hypothetical protein
MPLGNENMIVCPSRECFSDERVKWWLMKETESTLMAKLDDAKYMAVTRRWGRRKASKTTGAWHDSR